MILFSGAHLFRSRSMQLIVYGTEESDPQHSFNMFISQYMYATFQIPETVGVAGGAFCWCVYTQILVEVGKWQSSF